MALRMEPGYAYKRVRGEWDTVVISDDVADRARHVGYREIDGSRMAVFTLGRSTYAQLPQNLRRVEGADDNPLSSGAKAAIALGVGVAALAGGIGIAVAMSKPKTTTTATTSSGQTLPGHQQVPGYGGGGLQPGGSNQGVHHGGGGSGTGPAQTFALKPGDPTPTAHAVAGGKLTLMVTGPISSIDPDPAIQSSTVTGNTANVVLSGKKGQVAAMWSVPGSSMSGTTVVNVT